MLKEKIHTKIIRRYFDVEAIGLSEDVFNKLLANEVRGYQRDETATPGYAIDQIKDLVDRFDNENLTIHSFDYFNSEDFIVEGQSND